MNGEVLSRLHYIRRLFVSGILCVRAFVSVFVNVYGRVCVQIHTEYAQEPNITNVRLPGCQVHRNCITTNGIYLY